ncbi:hypothetical protein [Alicyclobacillus sp. ALC3]|uniref:hypothetical protein n=1 Tax=Alicyclobacillus sp. ALC3 TaxID=2796143 RepID=UPI002378ED57|nr:hypothetical protein [Alicyclobacillus sp. ALC3]WDL96802.1 hypothetical protein JC200_21320 [Alicyclobacillus sp. ALC3]
MSEAKSANPIVIELDEKNWNKQLDEMAQWLGNVVMTQASFREYVENTIEKITEPNVKARLSEIAEGAKEHEQKIKALYQVIDRNPAPGRKFAGEAVATLGQAIAGIEGALGGAAGPWRDIHRLVLSNLNSMGAFAITE